ncbi:MAG: ferredoxin [Candidatus Brocadiia bacterium]
MRAQVDESLCIASLRCQQLCPEVFQVVGNVSQVQVQHVPPEFEEACRQAAEACPSGAIRLIED